MEMCSRAVVEHVLVNFVGDRERVPLDAKIADGFKFGAVENFSGGIIGRIYDDGFGRGAERGGQVPPDRTTNRAGAASRSALLRRKESHRVHNFRRTARTRSLRRRD